MSLVSGAVVGVGLQLRSGSKVVARYTFLMRLRPKPREKRGTLRRSPREGSRDALCGHGGPKFLCPWYRPRLPILILIFLPGLRLIRYSQGSWIKFVRAISSYSSNTASIFLNLFVNESRVPFPTLITDTHKPP